MVAVEPVFQVNPRLSDAIIGPHEIVIHDCNYQLCLQRERHCEFKYPERRVRLTVRYTDRSTKMQLDWQALTNYNKI